MGESAERLAFIIRVFAAFDTADCHDSLYWHVTPDDGLSLYAMCNDTFWWATADCEPITPQNVSELEQALVDLGEYSVWLSDLFAARVRKMRPQRPFYRHLGLNVAPLFDACGPVRDPKDEG